MTVNQYLVSLQNFVAEDPSRGGLQVAIPGELGDNEAILTTGPMLCRPHTLTTQDQTQSVPNGDWVVML